MFDAIVFVAVVIAVILVASSSAGWRGRYSQAVS